MKKALEKLWNDYFAEECAIMNTKEERKLIRKAAKTREAVNALLRQEQSEAMERYIEALYEMQGFCVKKAFIKGCEFAVSFFLEAGIFGDTEE